MKIFIGFENISSTVTDIQKCFQEMGHECFTAINNKPSVVELNTANFVFQAEFDKIPLFKPRRISVPIKNWWEKRVRKKFFEKCLHKFDVFIFLWSSFKPDFSDLEILKQNNKKIIFVFVGDDVRWRNAASQEFEKFGLSKIPVDKEGLYSQDHLQKNLKRLRYAEKYADVIFSRTDQAQLQLRPYYRWNMMVDPHNYKHNSNQKKVNPVIIHAPTARKSKGTDYVYKAFEKLKQDGILFTPVLIENIPHLEAIKIYESADIIIDQLIFPGTGKFASEGLAMGKVVISQMGYGQYPQKNPVDCPVVDAGIDTLYPVLKELILNHDKRVELANEGRTYAEKYLLPKYFCESVLTLIQKENNILPDYIPDFFRNSFLPEPGNLTTYNNWTDFVKDCNWYKTNIITGERAGLKF